MAESKFHPALAVTNIKNAVPVTLRMENVQYSSWAELFRIHCQSTMVLDHIEPRVPSSEKASASDVAFWNRLDAMVLQWIYGTISDDLRETVIKPGATAYEIWSRLESIFHDNKNQRALYLEHQFHNLHLDDFPNVSAYCQELKSISDQLGNIGSPVSNQRLVLRLVAGLNDNYEGLATMIRQSKPLPQFYEARSMLVLEETCKHKKAAASNGSESALHARQSGNSSSHSSRSQGYGKQGGTTTNNYGSSHSVGRSNGRSQGKGRGNHTGTNGGPSRHTQQQSTANNFYQQPRPNAQATQFNPMQRPFNPWMYSPSPWAWQPWPYPPPPCPYPTSGWSRPMQSQAGILGPRPQAFSMQETSECPVQPTDLDSAMHTLSLNAKDENWIFDTGATSHMMSSEGYTDGDDSYEMY